MGNSEVGHNALGCGQVVMQGASLVDNALQTGEMFKSESWKYIMENCTNGRTGKLHMIGLLSDGGVHSRFDQMEAMIRAAAKEGASVRMHVLFDGRDVPDGSSVDYLAQLEKICTELNQDGGDVLVASGGGRMITSMDRYMADWNIVKRGWEAHVLGKATPFNSAEEALKSARIADPNVSDQFLPSFTVVGSDNKAVGPIVDGDSVLTFNFRGDRMVELAMALSQPDFKEFDRVVFPDIHYAGIMTYDGDLNLPAHTLVNPPAIEKTSGEYLVKNDVKCYAVSETQKYGHVTYFFAGNRSGYFNESLEEYVEIPSDKVIFNEKPEMKAKEIADMTVATIESGKYDFIRLNFPGPDMVGHTGDMKATVRAVEATDKAMSRVVEAVNKAGGAFVICADHGNADEMVIKKKGKPTFNPDGTPVPCTSHTLSPVPCIIGGPSVPATASLREDLPSAGLANVTATFMNLLGFEAPANYEPSLLN
eukprot:TRINITY_DN33587_c0_g1_i1.p1 TRINITY_DN33587_c0_g1~~TRINITY_DN33587_c0_g1_i1.p1  ORF type:complete len:542 (-),score=185.13 TRINITY_DN33587_c0_g1_i1:10-1446(-)